MLKRLSIEVEDEPGCMLKRLPTEVEAPFLGSMLRRGCQDEDPKKQNLRGAS